MLMYLSNYQITFFNSLSGAFSMFSNIVLQLIELLERVCMCNISVQSAIELNCRELHCIACWVILCFLRLCLFFCYYFCSRC